MDDEINSEEPVADVPASDELRLEDIVLTPGTYFNPQTEVLVVVDDSASMDQEVFSTDAYEGADWVQVSEDVPVDVDERDRLLEDFQTHHHPGAGPGSISETGLEQDDAEEDDGESGPQPGPAA